jgi:arylsulfatase A-like enzyme
MKKAIVLLVALTTNFLAFTAPAQADDTKPNVLFIAIDDLRPELACYGKDHIRSPNIDRLAESGMLFERSYCMVPTCGASRASLMSGLRPTYQRFVSFDANAEKEAPGITTLNTHFKNHGYHTVSNGKVYHATGDSARGWSEAAWKPAASGQSYRLKKNQALASKNGNKNGPPFESADAPDEEYPDAQIATKAISDLQRLKDADEPFFLAVGFLKPHLPFVAPKKYWDLYDHDTIHLPTNYHPPQDAPKGAVHRWGELRTYATVPSKGRVSKPMARNLIHGYYACVSFTDAQIGRVLNELDRLELADNTIVVLWGDHGWNLAEHTMWCKHSCFETSMHAPLILRAPGVTLAGQRTRALTEFIDIYPSMCELAGLPLPDHLEGQSFLPIIKNPKLPGKAAAIGRFKSGDTIRTDRFRFSEYTTPKGEPTSRMLYDHQQDPGENVNISEHPDQKDTVKTLTTELHNGKGKQESK